MCEYSYENYCVSKRLRDLKFYIALMHRKVLPSTNSQAIRPHLEVIFPVWNRIQNEILQLDLLHQMLTLQFFS